MTDPDGPDYLVAHVFKASEDIEDWCQIEVRYHCVSQFNPWNHSIEVTVRSGSVPPNEMIRVTCAR